MKTYYPLLGALLLTCMVPVVTAGTMSGIVQQLDGKALANVRIVVVDVASGDVLKTFRSGPSGDYNINFTEVVAVSITFDDGGVHEEAALIGIPGNIAAQSFNIFMPDRKADKPEISPCPPCQPCKPCCKPCRKHCKRLFRR